MLMFATGGLTDLSQLTGLIPFPVRAAPPRNYCDQRFLFTSPPLSGDKQIWRGRQQL